MADGQWQMGNGRWAMAGAAQYQEDVVLGLHNLKQLNDAAMGQAAQNADLPLYAPLVHCLLQQTPNNKNNKKIKHIYFWLSLALMVANNLSSKLEFCQLPNLLLLDGCKQSIKQA